MTKLDVILSDADEALQTVAKAGSLGLVNPTIPAGAAVLDAILHVIQSAVTAHEQSTGQPLDLSKLHQIAPLPEPTSFAAKQPVKG